MADYTCKCLNIRIRKNPAVGKPPMLEDSGYVSVYVGEQGITVIHSHLTLRTRTRSKQLAAAKAEQSMLRRYMVLRCLVCKTDVYRVAQVVPSEMDAPEGPVLSSDDWVELETLKSTSGWIELSKECLSGPSVTALEVSPSYSSALQIVIPSTAPDMSAAFKRVPSSYSLSLDTRDVPSPKRSAFPSLPPILPPAPFTPSHPVFGRIASFVLERSDAIRQAAEEQMAKIINVKVSEIEKEENELRRQVAVLWNIFRDALNEIEIEKKALSKLEGSRRTSQGAIDTTLLTQFSKVARPALSSSGQRAVSSTSQKPSALSASLASSSFHHPEAQDGFLDSSPTSRHDSAYSTASSASSPRHSGSFSNGLGEEHYIMRGSFRRDLSDSKDVATSFKYTIDLEGEMKKHAAAQEAAATSHAPRRSTSPKPKSPAVKSAPKSSSSKPATKSETGSPSFGKVKGKRKVTFDVKSPPEKERSEETQRPLDPEEDTIFDLDDEIDGARAPEALSPELMLPLNEPPTPHVPLRSSRLRSVGSLPESLSLLRPASLPAPSALHKPQIATEIPIASHPRESTSNGSVAEAEVLSPLEEEISKLVAAGTPSHRHAWKKDSKSWELFSGRDRQTDDDDDDDDDDDEGDTLSALPDKAVLSSNGIDWNQTMTSSLPISIGPISKHQASGLVYEPKTSLSDNYGLLVPSLRPTEMSRASKLSTTALRKAAYAERDRTRSMDPGALDFVVGEDTDDDVAELGLGVGSRGRQNALRILQARSSLPAEGMWRSLAT
ncbi:hypothetical protein OF83DRAFT_1135193 [Amylostereum chailletii]|nr:hypothetical protein OF83DRAFT_1135193 [Amylostereum chailletii]